jgi:hypothetical protein
MKKLFAILAVAAFAFSSCSKDDDKGNGPSTGLSVSPVIRPFFVDYTATWCGPCGQYGGPNFDAVLDAGHEGSLLTAMKAYSTSSTTGMGHPIYTQMTSAFSVSGIPDFWVNNNNPNTNSSSVISTATNIQNDTTNLVAGVALKKSVVGDSMLVTTKVKFFKDGSSNSIYSIAVYLVEDNVRGYQLVGGTADNNYLHRNVLRAGNSSNYYGVALNTPGVVPANTEFDNSFKIGLNPTWNRNNLKAIAVIWKNGATPYRVINSNVVK